VVLLQRELDLPFNVRPARENVPIALNTTSNETLYCGRQLDFYYLSRHRSPMGRSVPLIRTVGLGYGQFTSLGSSVIRPS
jgi:hypothetical protein